MNVFSTTLAPWQVADIWAELEDAFAGRASYGGDTTEIYAFRLHPHPVHARDALLDVARAFQERRGCPITVDGKTLHEFSKSEGFAHRVRVRVRNVAG